MDVGADRATTPATGRPRSRRGTTTRYTIPSLTNGTPYTVRVIATRTGANDGPPAAEVTASPGTTPGAPQHLSAVPGYAQVTLTWDAPSSDGGSAILRYEVAVDDSGTWIDAGLDLEETVTGLTNGQRYTFAVRAVNAAGTGPGGGGDDCVLPAAAAGVGWRGSDAPPRTMSWMRFPTAGKAGRRPRT